MGRSPCCSKEGLNRGAWTPLEDKLLTSYIQLHGEGKWRSIPKKAGLKRCGKSCRLRWLNYLRPDIKRGNITEDEEELIIRLHRLLGNRWSLIAARLPGRTDNEIKNYWNTTLAKKVNASQKPSKPRSRTASINEPEPTKPTQTTSTGQVIHTKPTRGTKVLFSMFQSPESTDTTATQSDINAPTHKNNLLTQLQQSYPCFLSNDETVKSSDDYKVNIDDYGSDDNIIDNHNNYLNYEDDQIFKDWTSNCSSGFCFEDMNPSSELEPLTFWHGFQDWP